ncbi:hypothetical protein HanPSC8_Chr03g0087561 [Helianthus annuus]|nr:hypothetical protein HanLR1_Chr03g0080621 [Helianthus annuus]KAJ0942070.1 hypothetical protein HanPSC8_Chr03g0087561 [Helianthus annuus]
MDLSFLSDEVSSLVFVSFLISLSLRIHVVRSKGFEFMIEFVNLLDLCRDYGVDSRCL